MSSEEAWRKFAEKAIAVVGADRLVKDDVTPLGLHRKHVVRKGELPDVEEWKKSAPAGTQALYWTWIDDNGIGHLWICWKEKKCIPNQ